MATLSYVSTPKHFIIVKQRRKQRWSKTEENILKTNSDSFRKIYFTRAHSNWRNGQKGSTSILLSFFFFFYMDFRNKLFKPSHTVSSTFWIHRTFKSALKSVIRDGQIWLLVANADLQFSFESDVWIPILTNSMYFNFFC